MQMELGQSKTNLTDRRHMKTISNESVYSIDSDDVLYPCPHCGSMRRRPRQFNVACSACWDYLMDSSERDRAVEIYKNLQNKMLLEKLTSYGRN